MYTYIYEKSVLCRKFNLRSSYSSDGTLSNLSIVYLNDVYAAPVQAQNTAASRNAFKIHKSNYRKESAKELEKRAGRRLYVLYYGALVSRSLEFT